MATRGCLFTAWPCYSAVGTHPTGMLFVHEILPQKNPMGLCYAKVVLNISELEIISLVSNVNINKINILMQALCQ